MLFLKNKLGFSLPELTIALGLLGGISLVTMKIMEEQASNEAYIRTRSEISKTISLVTNALSNQQNCKTALEGRTVLAGGSSDLSELSYSVREDSSIKIVLLQEGATFKSGYKVESLSLTRPTSPDNQVVLNINFRLKSRNTKLWGAANQNTSSDRFILEKIPLTVSFDSSNQIIDCQKRVSDVNVIAREKFCKALGQAAEWDSSTGCSFKNNLVCDKGFFMKTIDKLGGGVCAPIIDHINLYDLFDPAACEVTGTFETKVDGGKIKLNCP